MIGFEINKDYSFVWQPINKRIKKMIKNNKGKKVPVTIKKITKGMLVARININNGTYKIGWSLCHKKDNFNPIKAMILSMTRLNNNFTVIVEKVPFSILKEYEIFEKNIINGLTKKG